MGLEAWVQWNSVTLQRHLFNTHIFRTEWKFILKTSRQLGLSSEKVTDNSFCKDGMNSYSKNRPKAMSYAVKLAMAAAVTIITMSYATFKTLARSVGADRQKSPKVCLKSNLPFGISS